MEKAKRHVVYHRQPVFVQPDAEQELQPEVLLERWRSKSGHEHVILTAGIKREFYGIDSEWMNSFPEKSVLDSKRENWDLIEQARDVWFALLEQIQVTQ